jgi:hypothetical protein
MICVFLPCVLIFIGIVLLTRNSFGSAIAIPGIVVFRAKWLLIIGIATLSVFLIRSVIQLGKIRHSNEALLDRTEFLLVTILCSLLLVPSFAVMLFYALSELESSFVIMKPKDDNGMFLVYEHRGGPPIDAEDWTGHFWIGHRPFVPLTQTSTNVNSGAFNGSDPIMNGLYEIVWNGDFAKVTLTSDPAVSILINVTGG